MQSADTNLFSLNVPDFQVIWDSSSLRPLMECPRKYELSIVRGWTRGDDSNDLLFGSLFHAGEESFYRAITEGQTHDDALKRALRVVLMQSWDYVDNRPLMGSFEEVWRCQGTTKFKNEKGNPAKCPFSHKGKLFPAPGPQVCSCGSETEHSNQWFPSDPAKDRVQLLRAIVWYTEEVKGGPFQIVSYANTDPETGEVTHEPLVEIPWRVDLFKVGEETVQLAGNSDAIKTPDPLGTGEVFCSDYKTTKSALSGAYFSQFEPNVQVSVYGVGTPRAFPDLAVAGVQIEAIQVLQSGVRFANRVFRITDGQTADFYVDLEHWIGEAYAYAKAQYWPRNFSACRLCGYKDVCSRESGSQGSYLALNFRQSYWNPLTRSRGPTRPA
jgi:hypothetical protein